MTVKKNRKHLDASLRSYAEARQALDELASGRPGGPLHPQQIARVVSELASDDAIFTCDVGLPTVWAARYLDMNGRRRLLGSFWHGSMANAMAQAIGAQAAFPQRQVISLSGDGGFTMLMGDLLSLSQLELPVKVIVFNNGSLGFIELEQKASGFLDTGTALVNPNFAAMAEAVGIKGVRIVDPAEVEGKLAEALAHPGPMLVDAVVNRMELAMPPKVTTEMAKGFTLYMLKAVLNGRRRNRRAGPIQLVEMTHSDRLDRRAAPVPQSAQIFRLIQISPVAFGFHVVAMDEPQRGRVDAIAQAAPISRAVGKDMPEMAVAMSRTHLRAGHSVSVVPQFVDVGRFDRLGETRPTAPRLIFVG